MSFKVCSLSLQNCIIDDVHELSNHNTLHFTLIGHLSEELTALLTGDEKLSVHGGAKGAEYNIPKSVININLRKGVPARKKR